MYSRPSIWAIAIRRGHVETLMRSSIWHCLGGGFRVFFLAFGYIPYVLHVLPAFPGVYYAGHPYFEIAFNTTIFIPFLLGVIIDLLTFVIGKMAKTGSHRQTINHWRVYLALIPGLQVFVLFWYVRKIYIARFRRAKLVYEYSKNVRTKNSIEGIEEQEQNSQITAEKRDKVLSIAERYKQCKEDYSTYAREFFYIFCLIGFGQDLISSVLFMAFGLRTGLNLFGVIAFCSSMVKFTYSTVNLFYYLPRKYLESIPFNIPSKCKWRLRFAFFFSNIARVYVLVFLATYVRYWIYVFYITICLMNMFLSRGELKKNPKFTILFIIFSPISPCIVPTPCKIASPFLLSLGLTLNLIPLVLSVDSIGIDENPPITHCHKAAGNFSGDWVRCPRSYQFESGPVGNCIGLMDDFDRHPDYVTFCKNEHYFDYAKYCISAFTTLISITLIPYLADFFNHPDSFTGDHFVKQTYRKITSLLSTNHEVMNLRRGHFYMKGLLKQLYLGRIPPTLQQREKFLQIDLKVKELSSVSLLQWSIRESYFHLARYLVVRYKAQVGKEEWHEACKKGWVEFIEMLISQELPKVPSQDMTSKLFRFVRQIGCWKDGYPKSHPTSEDEMKLALEKFCETERSSDPEWIKHLFSSDNLCLIEAINDNKSEMGSFLRLVHKYLKEDFDLPDFTLMAVDQDHQDQELQVDRASIAQDILEIQSFGRLRNSAKNVKLIDPDPRYVCKTLNFEASLGLWKIHFNDWSEVGDNQEGLVGEKLRCCPSFFYCLNKGGQSDAFKYELKIQSLEKELEKYKV